MTVKEYYNNLKKNSSNYEATNQKLIDEGFDGVFITDDAQGVVFPQSVTKLKTKQQLIDIWNKANGK